MLETWKEIDFGAFLKMRAITLWVGAEVLNLPANRPSVLAEAKADTATNAAAKGDAAAKEKEVEKEVEFVDVENN